MDFDSKDEEKLREIENYLYSFINLERIRGLKRRNFEVSLESFKELLSKIGNPESKFFSIHIGGTKGKGSVASMLNYALNGLGLKVGLYTSPHLFDIRERIKIDNKPISIEDFYEIINYLKPFVKDKKGSGFKTTFEILTATAFYYFYIKKVDIAIIEVGLGGRLDATNVIKPLISIITNIGYDHQEVLGYNIKNIALEKAGIIKRNTPLILSRQNYPIVYKIIKNVAKKLNSPVITSLPDFKIESYKIMPFYTLIEFNLSGRKYKINLPLAGKFQIDNFKTTIIALHKLYEIKPEIFSTDKFSLERIIKGLEATEWKGRFQTFNNGKGFIIFDIAHNGDAFRALIDSLKSIFKDKSYIFILAFSCNKNFEKIFEQLRSIKKSKFIFTKFKNNPRYTDKEVIEEYVRKYLDKEIIWAEDFASAYKIANEAINWQKEVIVISGSIYFVSEAMEQLGLRKN